MAQKNPQRTVTPMTTHTNIHKRRRVIHLQPRTTWSLIGTLIGLALPMGNLAADQATAGNNLPAAVYALVALTALTVAGFVFAA